MRLLLAIPAMLALMAQGAERPVVSVAVPSAPVPVGEPFAVSVRVRAPGGATIRFPAVPDSGGGVEAVDPRAIVDRSTADVTDQTATYTFVAWEPGVRVVPLADLAWERGRRVEPLALGAIRVQVAATLPADTAEYVAKPARAPFPPPPQWWRWVLAAMVVLAMAALARMAWRRRATRAPVSDPFADAEREFAAVHQAAFDDAGEPGRAVLAYAEVMRAYLTRRFPAAGEGLTTNDYVQALEDAHLPILPDEVRVVLDASDAVKFAGAAVDSAGVAVVARKARGVVRDVQTVYEARLAAADKGKGPRGQRRRG